MAVDKGVKKAVEEASEKQHTSGDGKPDQIKDLRKEVEDGTL